MRVYRLKHIPTGLYYIPNRRIRVKHPEDNKCWIYVESNLSKKGKIYHKVPSLKWFNYYHDHTDLKTANLAWIGYTKRKEYKSRLKDTVETEWMVEEITDQE